MKGELVLYFPEPIDVKEFVDTLTWFQVETHPLLPLLYLRHTNVGEYTCVCVCVCVCVW